MAFSPGTRVGPYEIVGLLGAGGMGEVYRARDTRLQRDVAIKILPELFALDPERRARFEREAQVLASLNHPHIAAIYGFEESESTGAIVMELVEGPTLADRIARGPVPIGEALVIAKQLVLALDAAHEKGIVHRDLKPANIKLTADGTVKVLDFGLAKALSGDGAPPAAVTQSPTLSAVGTRAGVILGTAAYMSPEQARGYVVDKRTDIWAFGCVLYELLTGRKAFQGETVSDVVVSILTREPEWSELPPDTPSPVRALLRRCLDRDPRRRLRDIADAFVDVPVVETARPRHPWLSTIVGLLGGAVRPAWSRDARRLSYIRAGLFAPANLYIVDLATGQERQLTRFTRGNEGISGQVWLADDRHIMVTYVPFPRHQAMTDLGILDTASGSITRLTMTVNEGFSTPSVSADGSRLIVSAFRNVRGVWKVSATPGVPPSEVMDSQGDPMWTYVTRDGRTLLVNSTISGSRNLWLRPVDRRGAMRQITFIPGDAVAHSSLSPDGTRVSFVSAATGNSDIWVQNVDGTALRQLTNDIAADSWPIWSPDGQWIVFQAIPPGGGRAQPWRVPSAGGAPERIVDGGVRGDWTRQPSGSGTWIVTSAASAAGTGVRLIDVERRAVVWETRVAGGGLSLPMFSPDGRRFSMPYAVARDRDAIGVFDTATGKQLSSIQLPFHVLFRASWVDEGQAFLVNRTDQSSNVALFDRFWTPPN